MAVIQVTLLHKVLGQVPVSVEMLLGIQCQSSWGTGEGVVMLEVTFGNLETSSRGCGDRGGSRPVLGCWQHPLFLPASPGGPAALDSRGPWK